MKTESIAMPAISTPRALVGLSPGSIGVLLALLVFVAFPSSSALALPDPCGDVEFSQYTYSNTMWVIMYSNDCAGGRIFCTISGLDPTHNGPFPGPGTIVYTQAIVIPYGQCRYFRALA
jgi:hypothetical protein